MCGWARFGRGVIAAKRWREPGLSLFLLRRRRSVCGHVDPRRVRATPYLCTVPAPGPTSCADGPMGDGQADQAGVRVVAAIVGWPPHIRAGSVGQLVHPECARTSALHRRRRSEQRGIGDNPIGGHVRSVSRCGTITTGGPTNGQSGQLLFDDQRPNDAAAGLPEFRGGEMMLFGRTSHARDQAADRPPAACARAGWKGVAPDTFEACGSAAAAPLFTSMSGKLMDTTDALAFASRQRSKSVNGVRCERRQLELYRARGGGTASLVGPI